MAIPKLRTEWPETMSAQEVFDAVIQHLRDQRGERAYVDGACVYRGPRGEACAVGCLLLDDEIAQIYAIDDVGGDGRVTPGARAKWGALTNVLGFKRLAPHRKMLSRLQRLHDVDAQGGEKISPSIVRHIANHFGVTYTRPTGEAF